MKIKSSEMIGAYTGLGRRPLFSRSGGLGAPWAPSIWEWSGFALELFHSTRFSTSLSHRRIGYCRLLCCQSQI